MVIDNNIQFDKNNKLKHFLNIENLTKRHINDILNLADKFASDKNKKFVAIFKNKRVHFGAAGYSDYTIHKDKKRRELYRNRHRKDRINEPQTPGALSWWILWGESTNMQTNIRSYRKRFKN